MSKTPFWVFSLIFGIVGIIFGILMGVSLGLWTVGRRFRPITQYSVLGFGLGGLVLGYSLWRYIFTITNGDVNSGPISWIVLGFFSFAALGGAGLGYAYQRIAEKPDKEIVPIRALTRRAWRRRWMIIGLGLVILAFLFRPILAAVGDLMTPIDAKLSPVLDLPTEGTHWFDATPVAGVSTHPQPAISAKQDQLALTWIQDNQLLLQAAWLADGQPDSIAALCLPTLGEAAQPQLAAGQNDTFSLVYNTNNTIETIRFAEGDWGESVGIGNGRYPANFIDNDNQPHAVWCAADAIQYWRDGQTETIAAAPACTTAPRLAQDSKGQLHAVWFQNSLENVNGVVQPANVIMESIRAGAGWTRPAIIGGSQPDSQPALTVAGDGSLHLAWAGEARLNYAAQVQYECDADELSLYSQVLYDIARQESYSRPEDPIPYCQNRYDRLLFTPNPDPAYSDAPAPPNGVYDTMGDQIRAAEYEVLFSTMWYDKATNQDSPGAVIAAAIADLYENVRANPAQYPHGMTVRIMLGNPPELIMGETTGQLWTLLDDLQAAGVDKMVDDEIGWTLEVADFEGNLPHAHVKTMVIDGKTATASGFNMTYDHFPTDHPSGKGAGRFDLGLQVTGPAAQATQRMFDDMWNGADQRQCLSLDPPLGIPWQATCYDKSASVSHAPETQKFYLAGGSSTVFSMYRSKVHDQADQQTTAVLSAAQESIDAIHVNFALDMICNLNILFNVCTVDMSPDYMDALIQAAQNGAKLRILVKPGPVEGIENNVAMDALNKRLQELGIAENVEVRYFDGPVHPKAILVDDQVLIVGSQNLHYSAYGTGGGLTEYSFAVEDPQAAQDFKDVFEFEWNRATPSQ